MLYLYMFENILQSDSSSSLCYAESHVTVTRSVIYIVFPFGDL